MNCSWGMAFKIWLSEHFLSISASVESAIVRRVKIGTAEIQLSCSLLLACDERSFDAVLSLTLWAWRADLPSTNGFVHRSFRFLRC